MQRTDLFRPAGFNRGAPLFVESAWIIVKCLFFLTPLPWDNRLKASMLRLFGATVGKGLVIRPRVNIHFPWKLTLGRHCWIGERCEILNMEPVIIKDYSALAHDVYIAAGSHDIASISMRYKNKPVIIEQGVWIATRVFVGPGVRIGANCVVGAGCIVTDDMEESSVVTAPKPVYRFQRIFTYD
jgi:putative colanic acid biosynthesis acetyltransferase WcaF